MGKKGQISDGSDIRSKSDERRDSMIQLGLYSERKKIMQGKVAIHIITLLPVYNQCPFWEG